MTFRAHKVVSALPATLEADAVYAVRVGAGFDLYITDSTGSIAHAANSIGHSVGDIKSGLQTTDHSGWVLLDGRATQELSAGQQARAAALGWPSNLPNATEAVLMQTGAALGSVAGSMSRTIAQNQLPNVAPTIQVASTTASNNSVGDHQHYNPRVDRWSSNEGAHTHNFVVTMPLQWAPFGGSNRTVWEYTRDETRSTASAGAHAHWTNIGDYWSNGGGGHNHTQNAHSHSATASSINGGVPQQELDVTPRTLSVNTFVYLGT